MKLKYEFVHKNLQYQYIKFHTIFFCFTVHCQVNNKNKWNSSADFEDVGSGTLGFIGDNLVEAPKMPEKMFIPFSRRAKKIDMRALKRSIWQHVIGTNNDNDNVDVNERKGDNIVDKVSDLKKFSDLVKVLPKMLAKNNAEALSVPIAFISLLHLANEKNLQIDSSDDGIDLYIRQG